ncbi:MAG: DUF1294 domain-containing protein [Methanoregula sp.]|jgi:uncharacterized membrane protein YsdA (DUF1294 family)|uniref:DUF1294 domain-containing protein n=1 Tax=Methanoregula sp. TaxID=2052170 RepID=UPI003D0A7539
MTATSLPLDILIFYSAVNIAAFLTFGYDKRNASGNRWRIGEGMLLVLAFFGPFGALSAMKGFRHKTRKMKFYLVPLFAAIHLVIILYGISTIT